MIGLPGAELDFVGNTDAEPDEGDVAQDAELWCRPDRDRWGRSKAKYSRRLDDTLSM